MDAHKILAATLGAGFILPESSAEFRFAQNAIGRSRRIIAAIYWDLNAMWHLQQAWEDDSSEHECEQYESQRRTIQGFLDQSVYHRYTHIFQDAEFYPLFDRVKYFLLEHGWALFAMCAQSEAFRAACLNPEILVWDEVRKLITANKRSIEIFVRSRQLDWATPLLSYGIFGLKDIMSAVQPSLEIGKEHVHHLIQTSEGYLKRPIHAGKAQTNINVALFKPTRKSQMHPYMRPPKPGPCMKCLCKRKCPCHNLGGFPDCQKCRCPQACNCKKPLWLTCFVCGATERCECRAGSMAGDLVELIEYPVRGTGVRALANIKAGAVLGEYVGEVIPPRRQCDDDIYALFQTGVFGMLQMKETDPTPIGTTSSAHIGNWTRYINHHCEPNCQFVSVVVGDRVTTIVEALQDIAIFEEITLHYGPNYWRSRFCQCGSSKCCQPPPKQNNQADQWD
ncbi:hypothetical protein PDE_09635 [Penicillium oxalicum 114-2]|uniref:SET domain-containing protein n=1 Tax=Penicillium oxalicum (strain 114-2 / CGMCC 5302) TaxID=933388 RepID=S8A0L5_PENO1|nr:hypothetical protein PDE_09635 [Penicillium oxalicum 114-2]